MPYKKKEESVPTKKQDDIKLEILIVLFSVLILVTAILIIGSPVNEMEKAIENLDYEEIAELYSEEQKEKVKEEFDALLLTSAENSLENYNNGNEKYEITLEKLVKLKNTGIKKAKINKVIERLTLLKQSKDIFEEGKIFINSSLLIDGINKLGKVVDFDTNYKEAQDLIKENIEERNVQLFIEAAGRIVESDCSKAIDYLEKNKDVDIGGKVQEKINHYKSEHIERVKEETKDYIDSEDFISAIKKLEENKKYLKEETNEKR
jgi:hypothetical protein